MKIKLYKNRECGLGVSVAVTLTQPLKALLSSELRCSPENWGWRSADL